MQLRTTVSNHGEVGDVVEVMVVVESIGKEASMGGHAERVATGAAVFLDARGQQEMLG